MGHTESGLTPRAAICGRGRKAFELHYVILHHPRQTDGGLTQRRFVFWETDFPGGQQYGMTEEITLKLLEKSVGVLLVRLKFYADRRRYSPKRSPLLSGVPMGGFGVFTPPPPHPRNSEGPPKSCQTQRDCENC